MALIKCQECGKEISDTARKCPNCGYVKPPKPMTKLDKIFIPIISILLVAGFFFLITTPLWVKTSYPHLISETRYDRNEYGKLVEYNYFNRGQKETDYSMAIIVGTLSIVLPTASIVTYCVLKKKEKENEKINENE